MGKTKQPTYRLVVADSRSPRDGRFIEIIGHYEPTRQPKVLHVKTDRARHWLSVGAQPSETVVYLLKQVHVLDENGKVLPASDSDGMVTVSDSNEPAPAETASASVEASVS
jgi:small subunit ribosomal protein S16